MSDPAPTRADRDTTKPGDTGSLTTSTSRGLAWMTGGFIVDRISTFAVQVALTYVLIEEQIALWALIPPIVTLCMQITVSPMRDVLLHRQKRFALWARQATWLAAVLGLAASLVSGGVAFLAAEVYDKPFLKWVMLLASVHPLLFALNIVPYANLARQMRFGVMTAINIGTGVGRWVVTLLAAWMLPKEMGALAFAIGLASVESVKVVVAWMAAPTPIDRSPKPARWRYFVRDYSAMSVAYLSVWSKNLGDRVILGFGLTDSLLAVYFIALQVAIQGYAILANQVAGVLLPALGKLKDNPGRQREAFLRSIRVTHFVGIPACVGLGAIAVPLSNLLYDETKFPALGVTLTLVAFVIAFRLTDAPVRSLLSSQGRFTELSRLDFTSTVLFMICVAAGMMGGGLIFGPGLAELLGAVVMEIVFHVSWNFYMIRRAIRPIGGTTRDALGVYAYPVLASAVAIGGAWGLGRFVPGEGNGPDLARLALIVGAAVVFYVLIALVVRPRELAETLDMSDRLLPARVRGPVVRLRQRIPGLG
ncbi:MAG: hypothetical protein Tsb0013_11240 [Phycisphaerales bacterium]